MSSHAKLFTGADHAELYAKYRLSYPAQVHQAIVDFMRRNDDRPKYDLALDVGCGSGQSTKPLAAYFTHVIGIDPSHSQIEEGNKRKENANVTLQVGIGEQLPCDSCSVDLVTCGQSFHWLDKNKFWAEVDRVLKPGTGCLALYGYSPCGVVNNDQVKQIYHEFRDGTLDGYWANAKSIADDRYRQITLPYNDQIRIDSMTIDGEMSLDSYIGYLSSWSAYRNYLKKNSDDPLPNVKARMLNALQQASGNNTIQYAFPVYMLLGRKPSINNG